jgi:hypothetical protein
MTVKVLSIEPTPEKGRLQVILLIGQQRHKFAMTVESFLVGDRELQVTNGDRDFRETFKFNQIVAIDISKLVSKVYNGEVVKLPTDVGELNSEFPPVNLPQEIKL